MNTLFFAPLKGLKSIEFIPNAIASLDKSSYLIKQMIDTYVAL